MSLLISKNRILTFLATILLLTFCGVSVLNYKMTREYVHAQILRNDLPLTMDNIYSELSAEMMRPLLVASSMASDTFLKEWAEKGELESEKIIRYLDGIKGKYGFFTSFFISDKRHIYYRYNAIHKTISTDDPHDQWYFNFISAGREYDFNVDSDEGANNALTIFINHRVLNKYGDLLGVTGVGLMVESVAQRIASYQEKYGRTVYLSDSEGTIQIHPDISFIHKKSIKDMGGMAPFVSTILEKNSEITNFEFERDGTKILLTVRYIKELDWFLYVEQNDTEAMRVAKINFVRTILIGFMVSTFIIMLLLITMNRYQKKLEEMAVYDELTGLANRRFFEAEFHKNIAISLRSGNPFSLILLDLDGFKKVNDSLGHLAGDRVLAAISFLLSKMIRPTDILSRWGGDEFVVLCQGDVKDGIVLAQRMRHAVELENLAGLNSTSSDPRNFITVSCGVTAFTEGETLDNTMSRVDKALYGSKAKGGNCVESIVLDK